MADPVPDVPVTSARRGLRERVSVVWLVPLVALVIALALAWRGFAASGPLIRIVFDDAAGVVARETDLRFRNVAVGLVESVEFTDGLEQVEVAVRLDPEVAPFVDGDASFWVVRPRISTQQITGIETVLSGVFIEGVWDNQPGQPQERFEGRDDAPLLTAGQEGLEFTLFASDGTLTSATPVLYNGVVAGQVGDPRLGPDGVTVEAEAVVYAPFDRLVNEATRFYDASGFRLSVGSAGAEVDFDSLGALLQGGLAFENFESGAVRARDGARFQAFYSEDLARDSLVADPDTPVLELSAVFSGEPIAGLAEGAPVELEGLRVGNVTSVRTLIDPERFGDDEIHLQASLAVQPTRLGLEGEAGRDATFEWLQARVDEGLRARLATASLLGGLKIQLVTVPAAPEARIDLAALPFPALPVTAPDVTDIAGTAQGLVDRVDNLPIEELLASATLFLDNAGRLVGSAETQAIPSEVRGLLGDVRGLTASAEVQALPADLRATLARIEAAAASLGVILDDVEAQGGVDRVLAAVDAAEQAASAVAASAEGLPALVARLDAVAAKAEALAIEPILAELQGVAAEARTLLADPALRALPGQAGGAAANAAAALAEVQELVAEARAAELPGRLAATLAAVIEVAATIDRSTEGVPALVARLDAVAARAETIDVQPLLDEVANLSADARALLAQPELQALPGQLGAASIEASAALAEARRVLAGVDGADLNARIASAITAAEEAAREVEASVAGVPALVARIDALAATARELPVEQLVAELTGLSASANALVSSEGTQALPADLSAALAEVEALLREAREADVVGSVNATLGSARAAAESLPGLVARASGLLDQAAATLAGFDETSAIVQEAQDAVREVAAAAGAVADLARAIERDPNSLIFGD